MTSVAIIENDSKYIFTELARQYIIKLTNGY
jgi:hypothetical protein